MRKISACTPCPVFWKTFAPPLSHTASSSALTPQRQQRLSRPCPAGTRPASPRSAEEAASPGPRAGLTLWPVCMDSTGLTLKLRLGARVLEFFLIPTKLLADLLAPAAILEGD